MIYVSSYWELDRWVRPKQSQWMVSILGPTEGLPWPEFGPPERHLKLCFDDTEHTTGGSGPDIKQIEEMISFFRRWNLEGSLIIHCHGGISRSPAAALVALAVFNPGQERQAASLLRQRGPHADPNVSLIRLADKALQLDGRLVGAAAEMTMPSGWGPHRTIELPVRVSG